ncbi:hypothetical protein NE852_13340 [Rhizobium sp. Pop5]|uniref:hypothetical protein n=1 Tax=Rhizobium sp. Pop5 TaxID=1223565 RepID=UPI000283AA8C|nr:hypothetical protein [Rhizobium sp. Pop5]EJZ17935.1 hypothetical protein RCCGEPOP_28244 [Rhizobium sp. Pop5]UVD55092.1 hypothetical protein NE852_13340 [Rhizobium sp. Pop5]
MKYFVLYALVCSLIGTVLLVVVRHVAPFNMERLGDQAALEPAVQPDKLIVRSTREPASGQALPGATGQPMPTGQSAPEVTDKRSSGRPAVSPDQWDLRPTDEPTVRKGGRVGTSAQ